ncbi:HAD family hydrolase [Streptomyces sp. NBC_00343]|uniref:HAD family hydrolase n=1 Tax=Streptomyces sp. NBC_00343 TaxID=2975719 RepID=UPI002E28E6BB|nr:HAD family hydrolase [Streptomyces sp. NBC_00343]
MTPLLIVSDLDGTLLDSRGRVSARTRAAVSAVRAAGHIFIIATGRPVRDVWRIAQTLGSADIAVCGDGSICYDFIHETVVDYRPIASGDVRAAVAALRDGLPGHRLGAERELELLLEDDFVLAPELCVGARRAVSLLHELDGRGFAKLIVQADGSALEYCPTVAEILPRACAVTVSTPAFCQVNRAGVTKATALRRLARRLGVAARDTIAFGDMPNDLSMLAWAGRSVAVANAHPDVLAMAHETTASHDEDGVARFLEQLVGHRPGVSPPRAAATEQTLEDQAR